jgi:putative copper export protein
MEVSRGVFLYSGIHSISIWPTAMAVLLAMLTLAKDRIIDSMQKGIVRGRSVCTLLAVLIAISMAGLSFLFIRQFVTHFEQPTVLVRPAGQSGNS